MFLLPTVPTHNSAMAYEAHVNLPLCASTIELSLQELQTVSGGNYLDNMGTINAYVASKVLPKINIAQLLEPSSTPWRSWGSVLSR
jgi:hypothetical protein